VLVIYDLEFTAWPGAQERQWTGDNEFREIVQIGALRVDPALQVDASFEALIRPRRNPVLSPYFEALTGITNEAVAADGQDFPSALNAFLKFCGGAYALSYGNDMVIIGENLVLQFPPGEAPATPLPPFVNVRPHLNRLIPATALLPAGELHQALEGAEAPHGQAHNALADCHGILEALRHLRRQGHPLITVI
jgi:inhibitor of KinA sporulation pathway (predicted exonuclease)